MGKGASECDSNASCFVASPSLDGKSLTMRLIDARSQVKAFLFVVVAFVGATFTNMKTLQYSNVETFIVFRSSTPLLISFCDYFFLGRQLPSRRSWLSLVGLLSGAFLYVKYDSAFDVRAYFWVALWFAVFTFDQVCVSLVSWT